MSEGGARLLVVGVDGLDFDLVHRLGDRVPTLATLVAGSSPHAAVFPPDSVPSWTSIVTGLHPVEHGQLTNVKFFLEDAADSAVDADVNQFADRCFWEHAQGDDIAVINPFLAHPPWAPKGTGAMVSGSPFAELDPQVADPRGLLTGERPPRMGGFTRIPEPGELAEFSEETLATGRRQWDYALSQLECRRWDLFFVTSLVIDRVEHYTWRQFDAGPPDPLADVILRAHFDLDHFLARAVELQGQDGRVVLLSDHGHGPRASMGVNLHELLRRHGLYRVSPSSSSARRRAVEWLKTMAYCVAPRLRLENQAIRLARTLPDRRAMKSGSYVGRPTGDSVAVPDVAGSNPFGGLQVPSDRAGQEAVDLLLGLRYRGRPVFRWIRPASEVLGQPDPEGVYPDYLFEMEPEFGPTWNLYGPVFAPVITRRRQSGGHTRQGVYAEWPPGPDRPPADSLEVHRRLLELLGST
jgi:hypothetical protein